MIPTFVSGSRELPEFTGLLLMSCCCFVVSCKVQFKCAVVGNTAQDLDGNKDSKFVFSYFSQIQSVFLKNIIIHAFVLLYMASLFRSHFQS